MALKYLLQSYSPIGTSYGTIDSYFQNVNILMTIDTDTKGSIISTSTAIQLDTSLSIAVALSQLPALVQLWVDANYNN